MEEAEKVRDAVSEFVEKLLSLVPPYDEVSMFVRECSLSRNFREIAKARPEFTSPEVFSILQKLLGIRIESSGSISFEAGYHLNYLIEAIYAILDDDEFRYEISEFIGKEIPNPIEEYVKVCIDAIRQQDAKMLEILRVLNESYSYSFESLKNELANKGIQIDDSSLKGYLRTLQRLGLVETGYGNYRVVERARRHLAKLLEGVRK